MYLTIDIGNSRVKTALFKGSKISHPTIHENFNLAVLQSVAVKGITHVIVCSVRDYPAEWKNFLKANFRLTELTDKTPVPIKNTYATPATLGKDRLSCAVASHAMFPHKNVLCINAGTCITYDFTDSKGVYHGGAISPGLNMRFKALHTFTGRLPLIEPDSTFKTLVGKTTKQSILSGVQQGMVREIEGIINVYKKAHNGLQIVVTGGSLPWLKKHLTGKINFEPFFTLKGLNVILALSVTQPNA
jgi:type III pantothenate kinase